MYEQKIGIFQGFLGSEQELIVGILSPYERAFSPLLGAFILVEVDVNRALLGRVTGFWPEGSLVQSLGSKYLLNLYTQNIEVPEEVKEGFLRYQIKTRLLGVLSKETDGYRFRPGIRNLPHLGAPVYTLKKNALRFVVNANMGEKSQIFGHLAFADEIYEDVEVRFDFTRLISKRSFIFARTGYGKSNLVKVLLARLFEQNPDVGVLIFDPEGEYSFSTPQGPGLADLPQFEGILEVYTNRPVEQRYQKFVRGEVGLDLLDMYPSRVAVACLSPEMLDRRYGSRLRGAKKEEWQEVVKVVRNEGYSTPDEKIKEIFPGLHQESIGPLKNAVCEIVRTLDKPGCNLAKELLNHLEQCKVVIVDTSMLSSVAEKRLVSLLLQEVFLKNQKEFTRRNGKMLKVIAVLEEAQRYLSEKDMQEESAFVSWVKEGRKYNLGSILITQQPGAISGQLLTQGDNFFALHLLSLEDLKTLARHNAHFTDDIIGYLLNEPIPGNVFFWSAPDQPYPVSTRVIDFNELCKNLR